MSIPHLHGLPNIESQQNWEQMSRRVAALESGTAMTYLGAFALNASNNVLNFDAIPQTYRHLRAVGRFGHTAAETVRSVRWRMNDIAAANYHWRMLFINHTVATYQTDVANGQSSGYAALSNGASRPNANYIGPTYIDWPNYSISGVKYTVFNAMVFAAAGPQIYHYHGMSVEDATGLPITKLSLFLDNVTAFDPSLTSADLYGVK